MNIPYPVRRLTFWTRKGWRKLISMRTALVLLFLLAIASVPGSLLPQRPLNPGNVDSYLASHGGWGRFLDTLGFFDVFGSVWFAAIYLLLFVSLIGCLVPRIRVHVKALRTKPLPAPKHLGRLPEHASFPAAGTDTTAVAALARKSLGRRWRAVVREEKGGVVAVSAEKGYSRESGNIVFHVALLVALVLIAVGRLFHYEGSILVTEGDSFCNSATVFDNWRPGRIAADGGIAPAPFCVQVDDFTAKYLDTGEPTDFASRITYNSVEADGSDGPSRQDTLRVNHPLRLGGDRLYLISHGYTPVVTVTLPSGRTYQDQPSPFIPQDNATYLSEGVFALADKHDIGSSAPRTDIGIQGLFAPTPVESSPGVYTSVAPQAQDPVLGIFVFQGDLGGRDGQARSVYSIDTTDMKKIGAANLRVGQTSSLPNGVTVRFDGYKQWVALQVSHDPTQGWLLVAAVAMVVGLIGSLAVRRRRVWVRVAPSADGPTLVTVGGLARSDSGNFGEEFQHLVETLRTDLGPPGDDAGPERDDDLVDATSGRS
ncbi:cytochrome c biogenesis protein ResB [Jatrophihabitans sp. YIM 134969]